MARRPVFVPDSDKPYVSEVSLDFEYFPDLLFSRSSVRLQVCMRRMWLGFLRHAFWRCRPKAKGTLEFS